jgi:N6-adenosine-specific RNA methylase IME4
VGGIGVKYRTIVADPPWEIGHFPPNGANPKHVYTVGLPRPYDTMTLGEIAAIPVDALAEPDAHLYLWTTNHYLDAAYDIVRAWRFRPVKVLTWCKTPRGLGLGGAFTGTTEFAIFARRGLLPNTAKVDTSWWHWPRGRHSEKPEAFLDLVEQVSPGPYLELFARRQRLGWDTWGKEALNHIDLGASA